MCDYQVNRIVTTNIVVGKESATEKLGMSVIL